MWEGYIVSHLRLDYDPAASRPRLCMICILYEMHRTTMCDHMPRGHDVSVLTDAFEAVASQSERQSIPHLFLELALFYPGAD